MTKVLCRGYGARFSGHCRILVLVLAAGLLSGCATRPTYDSERENDANPACRPEKSAPLTEEEREEISELALIVGDLFDALRKSPDETTPKSVLQGDLAKRWILDGYIIGEGRAHFTMIGGIRLFGIQGKEALYGITARHVDDPSRIVIAFRGTSTLTEWGINLFSMDKEVLDEADPNMGVGKGFVSIYNSLRYQPLNKDTRSEIPKKAWQSLTEYVGVKTVTVTGHSLGATLATYMSYDLAKAGSHVRGRFLASPRPGSPNFSKAFCAKVQDHIVYNNARDIVPQMPLSLFGAIHRSLPKVKSIQPSEFQVDLISNMGCNHHSISYAAILNAKAKTLDGWKKRLGENDSSPGCIRRLGPPDNE